MKLQKTDSLQYYAMGEGESVMITGGTNLWWGGGVQHGQKTYGMELRELDSTLLTKRRPWLDRKGVGRDDKDLL